MIKYLILGCVSVIGLLGCESTFEANEYEAERAEYCDGDVEKCEELKVSSSLVGSSSLEVLSSSSVVGLSSDGEKSSTDILSITQISSIIN